MLREQITVISTDGLKLEGELVAPDDCWAGAILTHPHPRHGGNMRSMMPGELIKELPALGVATLRFNFRGIGHSQGEFEDGVGEQLDIVGALDLLHEVVEGLPVVVFGSSFGADTALTVSDPRIDGWCALAPPLREEKLEQIHPIGLDPRPKHLVIAGRDHLRSPASVREVTGSWENTSITEIAGADHFFVGRVDRVVAACNSFIASFQNSARTV